MTMWISSIKISHNKILVRHTQRGYPLKEVSIKMNKKASILREAFQNDCKSPLVNNIYSEIFSKSLNALAFNMVALYYNQNNLQLSKNKNAILMIKKIMDECQKLIDSKKIKFEQTIDERINQTLSSTKHTMSMLTDYRNGSRIELKKILDTFNFLSKIVKKNINYTNRIYSLTKAKI